VVAQNYSNAQVLGSFACNLFIDTYINIDMKKIHFGDILVTIPFAYIISQSLLTMNLFWFFGALWTFDVYAHMRRKKDV